MTEKLFAWFGKSDRVVNMSRLEINVTRGVWFVAGIFVAVIGLTPNK